MELSSLKINILGDSITEGRDSSGTAYSYVGRLQKKYPNALIRNYGVGGSCLSNKCLWGVDSFCDRADAMDSDADVVLVDTAGRLHNRIDLMNELTKIRNVMRKVVPDAPHEVLLVLDGSTGQNAFQQAKEFSRATDITAMAITKLDGTAKGGVVVGVVDQFQVPVKFVGIGEGIDDLKVFDKKEFVGSLFSKDDIV